MPRIVSKSWVLILPALAVMLVFYCWPVVRILLISFFEIDEKAAGNPLGNYGLLFIDAGIQRMLWRTAWVCMLSTFIAVVLGYIIAYAMINVRRTQRSILLFCILVTFWLSVLVRSFAWITVLNNSGPVYAALNPLWGVLVSVGLAEGQMRLVRNEFGVVLGMVHYMIPFAVFPLYSSMKGIEPRLMLAARGLGCSSTQAFLRVFLPLSKVGLASSSILVFVYSLGFFVTPSLLGGGKVVMISEYIYFSMGQTLRWGLASMLSVSLLVSSFALIALIMRVAGSSFVFRRA